MARRTVLLPTLIAAAVLLACTAALMVAASREAEAAFPGKNGRIAFYSAGFIDSVRPDGSGRRTEAFPVAGGSEEYSPLYPAYSPDGTKLAYYIDYGETWDIHIKDLTTGQVTKLTSDDPLRDGDYYPAWSPDGTKIAFTYNSFGAQSIWVMDADGSNRRQLTDNARLTDVLPAWSPDGTKIAFSRDWLDIWVMDADGSNEKNLTRTPDVGDRYPSWSPDGTKIAWSSGSSPIGQRQYDDIWIMNADGTGEVRLTSFAGDDVDPAWSPNGRKIAFIREIDSVTDVWKMNSSDGSQKTNLIKTPSVSEYQPDWQPKPAP